MVEGRGGGVWSRNRPMLLVAIPSNLECSLTSNIDAHSATPGTHALLEVVIPYLCVAVARPKFAASFFVSSIATVPIPGSLNDTVARKIYDLRFKPWSRTTQSLLGL